MPGQRKRKRQQAERLRRDLAEYAQTHSGTWEVVYQTQDYDEWQAHLARLRAERSYPEDAKLRLDTFCGRLIHPTTYRLSVLIPADSPAATES